MPVKVIHGPGLPYRVDLEALGNLGELNPEPLEYEGLPSRHVYFALDAEVSQIKIGISDNVDRRVTELGRERGRELDLLGSMRGGYDLERAMHGRFRDYRRERNEWYSAEIIGEVEALLAQDAA